MDNHYFSKWLRFNDRNEFNKIGWEFPGVYAIAYTEENLSNKKYNLIKDIVYFGMTNSIAGLKGRLDQFSNTIYEKRTQHGGAERFCHNLSKEDKNWKDKLYVSIMIFHDCDVKSNKPNDLLIMGDVAKQEYICWAQYVEKFNVMPRFNDKKNNPKKDKK